MDLRAKYKTFRKKITEKNHWDLELTKVILALIPKAIYKRKIINMT